MYQELIERLLALREDYLQTQDDNNIVFNSDDADMLEEAAEAIKFLIVENEKLAIANDDLRVQIDTYDHDDLEFADARIKMLESEADMLRVFSWGGGQNKDWN